MHPTHATARSVEALYQETLYRRTAECACPGCYRRVEALGRCPTCAVAATRYQHAHPMPEEE